MGLLLPGFALCSCLGYLTFPPGSNFGDKRVFFKWNVRSLIVPLTSRKKVQKACAIFCSLFNYLKNRLC